VARQHAGEKKRKGAPATAAPAAIRAESTLPACPLRGGVLSIVARQAAVAVQRATPAAVGAALLLERKSSAFNAGSSATKRTHAGRIRRCCLKATAPAEPFSDGAADCGTRFSGGNK